MALINRSAVALPELRRELVQVDALGGEVAVVEMGLADRLDFEDALASSKGAAGKRTGIDTLLPLLLAACVRDDEGEPVFDAAKWRIFGARHRNEAIGLFNVAFRLSGFDGDENAKNS
jgi:hypothetical protein